MVVGDGDYLLLEDVFVEYDVVCMEYVVDCFCLMG